MLRNHLFALLFVVIIGLAAFWPMAADALGDTKGICKDGEIETFIGCIKEDSRALNEFIRQLYVVALAAGSTLAVIFITMGGIQYMTSSGNPDTIQKAKDRIQSALLGLGLLILAIVLLRTIGVGEGVL